MANLPRINLLQRWASEPSRPGSEWTTEVIAPRIQNWEGGAGRVLDPNDFAGRQQVYSPPAPDLAETGFAEYLRHFIPNTYIPKSKR